MGRNAPSKIPLDTLVSRLSIQKEKNEAGEAIATSKLILARSPHDPKTVATLVNLYLNNDMYSDLYTLFELNPSQKQDLVMEYGYALYKLGRHDELVALVGDRQDRGLLHLLAQSHYKQGHLLQARNIYSNALLKTSGQVDLEEYDLAVNDRAILAQLKISNSFDGPVSSENTVPESYDQTFNNALILIAEKKYAEALDHLTRAKVLCQTSGDLTAVALASELSPILVQASYVNILLNKLDAAAEILNTIDYENLKDTALLYLINNLKLIIDVSTNHSTQYTNPHKALAFLDSVGNYNLIKENFVPIQQQILSDNRFLLELAGGKSAQNMLKAKSKSKSQVSNSAEGYSFYKEVQDLSYNDQIRSLKKTFSSKKDNVALAFTIAQFHANAAEYSLASSAIIDYIKQVEEKSPEQAYAPGVISALSSLSNLSGKRSAQFLQILENAVAYWSKHMSVKNEDAVHHLLSDAAISLSETGKESLVKSKLEKLYGKSPENITIVSGLLGLGNAKITEKYASEQKVLLSVSEIVKGIDVEALSAAGLEPLMKKRKAAETESKQDNLVKRKHKKSKPSKSYDPERQADPERWLPLRDRSTYKPPKAKGKKKVLASTQGGAVDESLSVTSGNHTNTAPTPAVSKPKHKNIKKNKKKGRK